MKNIVFLLLIISSACQTPAPTVIAEPTSSTSAKADSRAEIKNSSPVQKIVFNTGSRGYQKNILFTKDSIVLVINSSFEEHPSKNIRTHLSGAEWDKLNASLNGIDITKINELKSPTTGRETDAGSHSAITITTDTEHVHDFDDYNPNEQLKKLMDVIKEIEKDRNK